MTSTARFERRILLLITTFGLSSVLLTELMIYQQIGNALPQQPVSNYEMHRTGA